MMFSGSLNDMVKGYLKLILQLLAAQYKDGLVQQAQSLDILRRDRFQLSHLNAVAKPAHVAAT